MPRYTDKELDQVKQGVDLVALVRSKGIELKKHGSKDLIGHCPFHEDDTPSFIVTPSKNLYHCMGCGSAGSPIDFVMKHDGLSFRHAVELLREQNPAIFSSSTAKKKSTVPKLDCPLETSAEDFELLEQTISYYQERLQISSDALAYLEKRKISKEAIEHFRIGYADRTLGLRLPHRNRNDGKELRERIINLGIYRKTGREHFNGCVTFPIFNEKGQVTELYGRKVCQRQSTGIYHLYLPGKHVGIYNAESLQSRNIILCESIIDALTLWSYGHKNATTIYGTEGFTHELEQSLITHKVQKVTFAYDNDKAGNRATERDAKRLQSLGIECFRLSLPVNLDVNQYAINGGDLSSLIASSAYVDNVQSTSTSLLATNKLAAKSEVPTASEPVEQAESQLDSKATKDKTDLSLVAKNEDYELSLGDRTYRIRGLHKNQTVETLKINLRLDVGELFYLDEVNLYNARNREQFINYASTETMLQPEMVKRDIGKLLLLLEQKQEERLSGQSIETDAYQMTLEEEQEALNFLKSPKLMEHLKADFQDSGVVGEDSNKLTAWLACVSRKLDRPLAVIIQSTSAAGKTTLMEAVLKMMPPEESIKYSAMTGQSLYYLGETNLKHKILAIVEEEGAEKASYALKLLQSEGELTIASTGKDSTTGRMETQEYHVEGPVMIFLTTTAIDIDEELMNRCLVLTVDEGQKQTKRIFEQQRDKRTEEGLIVKKRRDAVLRRQANVQRLLKPVHVVNNYARELTFVSHRTRSRRDHEKYLTLIDTITLAHQYQRERITKDIDGETISYIRTTIEDIELANQLAPEVLGRSLDELPPQTRTLLNQIIQLVKEQEGEAEDFFFSRRWLRDKTGWSEFQVRVHTQKLEDMEYIERSYGRQGQACSYRLLVDPETESHESYSIGLIDLMKLRSKFEG